MTGVLALDTLTKRAFILDDDADALDLVSAWLGDLGMQVETFSSSDPFLQALSHHIPDLIVLDLQLPVVDGVEVLELLAKRKVTCPVILLSAMPNDLIYNTRVVALHQGVNVIASFSKNITFEGFAEAAARSIQANPESSPTVDPNTLQFHYQPIVSLRTNQVQGVEALLRIHGNAPQPNQIRAMEMGNQCIDLWHATVERTFSDWSSWGKPELSLSLNISTSMLVSEGFRQDLVARCKAHGLPLANLTLELTERGFVSEPLPTFQGMNQIRILGVGLALDDFGKRFSTLERLRTLPFSDVKFDQELLSEQPPERLQKAAGLAHGLGFRTTAEAIETQAQLDLVMSLDIELAQGYLFSKPMAATRLADSGLLDRVANVTYMAEHGGALKST